MRAKRTVVVVAMTLGVLGSVACSDSGDKRPTGAPGGPTATTTALPPVATTVVARQAATAGAGSAAEVGLVEGSGLALTPVAFSPVVERGATATATFRGRPGSTCQLELQPAGGATPGQRTEPAVTDAAGNVTWTWRVDGVAAGPATAYVVCSGGSRGEVGIEVR